MFCGIRQNWRSKAKGDERVKAVLRSIKPYWLYLILIGKKRIEVGKNFPQSKDWNKVVYLYCSKDKKSFNRIPKQDQEWMKKYLGKVACQFVCKGNMRPCYNLNLMSKESCVPIDELIEYSNGNPLCGWRITNQEIYDKPRELIEFHHACKQPSGTDCSKCLEEGKPNCWSIIRPPQSWCYVEELGV